MDTSAFQEYGQRAIDNPLNVLLLAVVVYLIYSLLPLPPKDIPAKLPTAPTAYNWRPAEHPQPLVWRSWTPEELRGYDGSEGGKEGGRILFAIRRKVYDVTSGRGFYGPGASPTAVLFRVVRSSQLTYRGGKVDLTLSLQAGMLRGDWPSSRSRPICSPHWTSRLTSWRISVPVNGRI